MATLKSFFCCKFIEWISIQTEESASRNEKNEGNDCYDWEYEKNQVAPIIFNMNEMFWR